MPILTGISPKQTLDANLNLLGPAGGSLSFAHSGQVDWTDPFFGARIRHELAPGQEVALRGDIGGFDVGSRFSWQALATYNRHLFDFKGFPVDAYLGFRALSVDYTQGFGLNKYTYDVVQYGPVAGATVHFGALPASVEEPAATGGYKDGPVSATPVSWTGYYLGINGGGGWSDSNTLTFTDTVPGVGNPGSFDRYGGFGGIQAGYNRQGGLGLGDSWVLGLETEASGRLDKGGIVLASSETTESGSGSCRGAHGIATKPALRLSTLSHLFTCHMSGQGTFLRHRERLDLGDVRGVFRIRLASAVMELSIYLPNCGASGTDDAKRWCYPNMEL